MSYEDQLEQSGGYLAFGGTMVGITFKRLRWRSEEQVYYESCTPLKTTKPRSSEDAWWGLGGKGVNKDRDFNSSRHLKSITVSRCNRSCQEVVSSLAWS
jgi:hypothetical protein